MAGALNNTASGVVTIDALLGKFRWNSLNLTYNFPTSASYYAQSTYFMDGTVSTTPAFSFSTFSPVTPSLSAAIDYAIAHEFMAVSPLTYTKVAATAPADSSFARASLYNDAELQRPPSGVGYYSGSVQRGGDAWFNSDQGFNNVVVGNSAYFNVLHELGHTVGPEAWARERPARPDDRYSALRSQFHRIFGDDLPSLRRCAPTCPRLAIRRPTVIRRR